MSKIIKDRRIVDDPWVTADLADEAAWSALADDVDVIVPLPLWVAKKGDFDERRGRVGVCLQGHDEPQPIVDDLGKLPLIAVHFASFNDGRGYSLGRLLRERYGYKGELRATGDILRDQLFYLHRCGFNAFAVRADKSIDDALRAFDDFSDGYQASVAQPVPYFRRRLS